MTKLKLFLILFFAVFFNYSRAQIKEKILYRYEGKVESSRVGTYNVNILTLNTDNTYSIIFQTYGSKKMAKKHATIETSIEEGSWHIKNSMLTLIPNKNQQELVFLIQNKKQLRVMLEEGEISDFIWREIRR